MTNVLGVRGVGGPAGPARSTGKDVSQREDLADRREDIGDQREGGQVGQSPQLPTGPRVERPDRAV